LRSGTELQVVRVNHGSSLKVSGAKFHSLQIIFTDSTRICKHRKKKRKVNKKHNFEELKEVWANSKSFKSSVEVLSVATHDMLSHFTLAFQPQNECQKNSVNEDFKVSQM
jgi:hypothetical protein